MNCDNISAYLTAREGRPVTVDSVKRSAGGLSRETWFVSGPEVSYVFRCNLKGGASSCPVPLTFEFELHRRLPELGLPVTRALWFEEDPEPLGQPFYVRECVEGTSAVPGLNQTGREAEGMLIEASREHVRKMAQVHMVDWKAAGLDNIMPAPVSAADCALATVERIRRQHSELGLAMSPLVARAFSWFERNAPSDSSGVCLCKGSNGALQEVWRDGRIVALCDWELASIGDPANDWGRCLGLLPDIAGRWTPRDALDYYQELTGMEISHERLEYYRGIYALEMVNVCLFAGQSVKSGKLMDVRLEMLNLTGLHHSEMALRSLVYG